MNVSDESDFQVMVAVYVGHQFIACGSSRICFVAIFSDDISRSRYIDFLIGGKLSSSGRVLRISRSIKFELLNNMREIFRHPSLK